MTEIKSDLETLEEMFDPGPLVKEFPTRYQPGDKCAKGHDLGPVFS